ncbi:hypothetical protein Ahy_A05g025280 [Arachis hypogaea]|uniref:O-fucosyltransferase family protein n=1 Tax=Arachis hypogaea TaxID=3818 RepID=A0A445D8G2_ARAHY|nr:hypothetical protein Ahy_A05g025280 [Arachis hypogaea]
MVIQFKSWSGMDYYENEIAFMLFGTSKTDSRWPNNKLPSDIQKLRCRTCFEALRFSSRIEQMGKILVERMRSFGYEKDMVAFSVGWLNISFIYSEAEWYGFLKMII